MSLWACMHQTLIDSQNEYGKTNLRFFETDCIKKEMDELASVKTKSEDKSSPNGTFVWMNLSALATEEATDIMESWCDPKSDFSFPNTDRKDTLAVVNAFLLRSACLGGADSPLDGERSFLNAIIGYVCSQAPTEEQNLETVAMLLNAFELRAGDKDFKNAVDMLFDDLIETEPDCDEVKEYQKFKSLPACAQADVLMACSDKLESLGYKTEVEEKLSDFDPFADDEGEYDYEGNEEPDDPQENRDKG